MLLGVLQVSYLPTLVPAWLSLFVIGVASGAAMIPYTLIKEVNPDEVKGSATGGINFLTFTVTAVIGPVFAGHFGKTLGGEGVDSIAHFQGAGTFWGGCIVIALVACIFLRETGRPRN